MKYDAIVIGAGHNGLTTAAYLARASKKVLVLERRSVIGGCAVTEEVDSELAPDCRVSTASYIASMLSMDVIEDLKLASYGLTMVACEPGVQVAFEDGQVMAQWNDPLKLRSELQQFAPKDVETFLETEIQLKQLAAYLQPFFLMTPPEISRPGLKRAWRAFNISRHFKGIDGDQIGALISFLTGSLGEFLDRRFESEKLKRLVLANSLYGKHGGPYQPGTAMGLLFHLLNGGEERAQGFQGHVIGGMGAITQALAQACYDLGVEIRTESEVAQINVAKSVVSGVTLKDDQVFESSLVVSNADPKRTYLSLLDPVELSEEFLQQIRRIKMNGPCGKVNLVLSEEPKVIGMPPDRTPQERALFTLVPTLQQAENSYHQAAQGNLPDDLWVDCVLASNVDDTLAPNGFHMLTCFVQYLPYQPGFKHWDDLADGLGDRVVEKINQYAPNVAGSIVARDVITPLELERRFGITEGNIFHGDISLEQMFTSRPVPNWSRYQSPINGLYLCGAGTHPGGGVTAAPGYNAAKQILANGD